MKNEHKLIDRERSYTPWLSALMIVGSFTGFVTLALPHSTLQQAIVVSHSVVGVCLSLIIPFYTWLHFRRSLGFRRPALVGSGLVVLAVFLVLIVSGWHMLALGRLEHAAWVYTGHWVTGALVLVLLGVHLWGHFRYFPDRRKISGKSVFLTYRPKANKTTAVAAVGFFAIIPLTALLGHTTAVELSSKPAVQDYQYLYGDHHFRPSQTETAGNQFVDPLLMGNSLDCGSCHESITKQWFASAHRQAASDKSYETNVSLLAEKKGIAATRYCEGCHAPIALLSGQLSEGGVHGGVDDSLANLEGVSCLSCHSIHRVVHLKGVASYEFKPMQPYLFHGSNNAVLANLNHFLIKVSPQQHKKDLANPVLKDPKFCATCHAQFMDKDINGWGWVKMQDEYTAWLNSPYSGQKEHRFANNTVVRCQDCHMPLEHGVDPSADPQGRIRDHRTLAANTMLPLLAGDAEHLALTQSFLQSNRMRISIEKPHRKDAQQTLLPLEEQLREQRVRPWYFYLGEMADISVVVTNIGVGHDFPGGTVDINEAWIDFLVLDAEGRTIYHSGALDDDQTVDPNAYFYRAPAIDRHGKLVWRHDLFNMIGETSRTVVKAGESDIVDYQFKIPSWATSPLSISATLKYRKLNDRYAQWALKDEYQPIPVVDVARVFLNLPLKLQKPVTQHIE